ARIRGALALRGVRLPREPTHHRLRTTRHHGASITRNPGSGHASEVDPPRYSPTVEHRARVLVLAARALERLVAGGRDVPPTPLLQAPDDLREPSLRGQLDLVGREVLGVAVNVDLPQ